MQWLLSCARCQEPITSGVKIDDTTILCKKCWEKAECPGWRGDRPTRDQIDASESAVRARMAKRGGDSLHAVRSGRT